MPGPKAGRPTTTDTGAPAEREDDPEAGPLRRCAVTRERLAKERMIRFVVAPCSGGGAGRIVPDLTATLPGRGIWLSARGDVIETARLRGAFARAAREPVTVSPDLTSGLVAALTRRVGETLGLARRAGQAVFGFAKAREWLVAGRAGVVVQASDGSAEERARFMGAWSERVPVVAPLTAAELAVVFGRDHVVHVAVAPGRLAGRLVVEAERLAGVRAVDGPSGSAGRQRCSKRCPTGAAGGEGAGGTSDRRDEGAGG